MQIKIGLENGFEGRSMAWALDYPGCFAYGVDQTAAVLNFPRRLVEYQSWVGKHTPDSWLVDLKDFDVRLAEVFQFFILNESFEDASEGYMINAWFRHDWKPLTVVEARRSALLLEWAKADLLSILAGLSTEQLDRPYPGERWTVRGILAHTATAEWWLMDRLNLAGVPRADLPKDPFERLERMNNRLREVLPDLAGQEIVIGKQGELWSPRKLVRRAVWHLRDHTEHILKLLLS